MNYLKLAFLLSVFATLTVGCFGKVEFGQGKTVKAQKNAKTSEAILSRPAEMPENVYDIITQRNVPIALKNEVITAVLKVIKKELTSKVAKDKAIGEAVKDAAWAQAIKDALTTKPFNKPEVTRPSGMSSELFDLLKSANISEAKKIKLVAAISQALTKTKQEDRDQAIGNACSDAGGSYTLQGNILDRINDELPFLISKPSKLDAEIYALIKNHAQASIKQKNKIIQSSNNAQNESTEASRSQTIDLAISQNGNFNQLGIEIKKLLASKHPLLMARPAKLNKDIYDIIALYRLPNTYNDTRETIETKNKMLEPIEKALLTPSKSERDAKISLAALAIGGLGAKIIAKTEELFINEKPFDMNQEIFDFIKEYNGGLTIKEKNTLIAEINPGLKEKSKSKRDAFIYMAFTTIGKRNTYIPDEFIKEIDKIDPLLNGMPSRMDISVYGLIAKYSGMNIKQKNDLLNKWDDGFGYIYSKHDRDNKVSNLIGAAHSQLIKDIQEALQKDKPLLLDKPAGFSQGIYDLIKSQHALDGKVQNVLLTDMVEAMKISNLAARSNAIDLAVKKHHYASSTLSWELKSEAQKANPLVMDMPVGMNAEIYKFINGHSMVTADHKNSLIEAMGKLMAKNFDDKDERDSKLRNAVWDVDYNHTKYPNLAAELIDLVDKIAPLKANLKLKAMPHGMQPEVYNAIKIYGGEKANIESKNEVLEPIAKNIRDAQAREESIDSGDLFELLEKYKEFEGQEGDYDKQTPKIPSLHEKIMDEFEAILPSENMPGGISEAIGEFKGGLALKIEKNRLRKELNKFTNTQWNLDRLTDTNWKQVLAKFKQELSPILSNVPELDGIEGFILRAQGFLEKPADLSQEIYTIIVEHEGEDNYINEKINLLIPIKNGINPTTSELVLSSVIAKEVNLPNPQNLAKKILSLFKLSDRPVSMPNEVYLKVKNHGGSENQFIIEKNRFLSQFASLGNMTLEKKIAKAFNGIDNLVGLENELIKIVNPPKPLNMHRKVYDLILADQTITLADKNHILTALKEMNTLSEHERKSTVETIVKDKTLSQSILEFYGRYENEHLGASELGLPQNIYESIYSTLNTQILNAKQLNSIALGAVEILRKDYSKSNGQEVNSKDMKNNRDVEIRAVVRDYSQGLSEDARTYFQKDLIRQIQKAVQLPDYSLLEAPKGWKLNLDPMIFGPNIPEALRVYFNDKLLDVDWANGQVPNKNPTCDGIKTAFTVNNTFDSGKLFDIFHPDKACHKDRYNNSIPGAFRNDSDIKEYCERVAKRRFDFLKATCKF